MKHLPFPHFPVSNWKVNGIKRKTIGNNKRQTTMKVGLVNIFFLIKRNKKFEGETIFKNVEKFNKTNLYSAEGRRWLSICWFRHIFKIRIHKKANKKPASFGLFFFFKKYKINQKVCKSTGIKKEDRGRQRL